jgi:hypothetical protein
MGRRKRQETKQGSFARLRCFCYYLSIFGLLFLFSFFLLILVLLYGKGEPCRGKELRGGEGSSGKREKDRKKKRIYKKKKIALQEIWLFPKYMMILKERKNDSHEKR